MPNRWNPCNQWQSPCSMEIRECCLRPRVHAEVGRRWRRPGSDDVVFFPSLSAIRGRRGRTDLPDARYDARARSETMETRTAGWYRVVIIMIALAAAAIVGSLGLRTS